MKTPQIVNSNDEEGRVKNDADMPFIDSGGILTSYEEDHFFGPVVRTVKGEGPFGKMKRRKLKKTFSLFMKKEMRLLMNEKLDVLGKSALNIF